MGKAYLILLSVLVFWAAKSAFFGKRFKIEDPDFGLVRFKGKAGKVHWHPDPNLTQNETPEIVVWGDRKGVSSEAKTLYKRIRANWSKIEKAFLEAFRNELLEGQNQGHGPDLDEDAMKIVRFGEPKDLYQFTKFKRIDIDVDIPAEFSIMLQS